MDCTNLKNSLVKFSKLASKSGMNPLTSRIQVAQCLFNFSNMVGKRWISFCISFFASALKKDCSIAINFALEASFEFGIIFSATSFHLKAIARPVDWED